MLEKQRKLSTSFNNQSYLPFYFRGDPVFIQKVQLSIQTNLQFPKPHLISSILRHIDTQKQQFIEPIVQIQTFDETSRQGLQKNKSSIKQGVFYIYFPSNIRVDQKIYKIYDKNFENFLKDVPKAFRQNFGKFIIWQQAHGEHHIENQKQKINEQLSNCIKLVGEKKIEMFLNQISSLQNLDLNQRVMKNLFVVRNKLASVFKQLKLIQNASQQYTSLYSDILYNNKKFFSPVSSKQLPPPGQRVQFKSPFVIRDINKIFSYFDQRSNYLQITNFCFMKMFECHLQLNQQYEGMKKIKQYIDFIVTNLFNSIVSRQDDISKNLWIIDTIDQTNRILKGVSLPPIMNPQKQEETSLLNVSICSQYRNAIQRIGVIFYGLNTYVVFPRNLQYELNLCIKAIQGQKLTQEEYPELRIIDRQQEVNKLLFTSGEPVTETVSMMMNKFESYKVIYLRTLEMMQKTLSQSPYKKVAWSMKLSVLKSTIIYFSTKDEKRLSILSLLEENKTFSYDHRKSVWQKLQIMNKVYQLTLCKRYNIKMRVEDLINIILDDSIIHLREIWLKLVKIVSQLLFEYKRGDDQEEEDRLNSIDFGQTQNDEQDIISRRRRRTTIHQKQKKIEVGTIKFISLKDRIDQSPSDHQLKPSESLELSIELSNRIITYAMSLIQASTKQDPLIKLQFLITTSNNQQKLIPFTINQVEDKFIQAKITCQQVMIFKIQKILVDIGDNITLVYTMPLNHQKIQFYDRKKDHQNEEEQNFYVNISPELKINTLKLQEIKVKSKLQELQNNQKFRKQSTSSTTSRRDSQQSSNYSHNYKVYHKLWTPIKLSFTFQQNDEVQIEKIWIECQDEIYGKIFVGEKQVSYKQVTGLKIKSDEKHTFPLILFIKPGDKSQNSTSKEQVSVSSTKRHKQSITSFLPKSLRNRTHSITQSVSNSHHGSFLQSNTISLKLTIKHGQFTYPVTKEIKYSKKMPFKIQYRYSQEFEEYTIKNIADEELEIVTDQEETFQISMCEELKVFSSTVKVCLKYADTTDDSQSQQNSEQGESFNLMKKLKLDETIDLTKMIKKQHLKPQKLSTIWLELQQHTQKQSQKSPTYSLFQPIRLLSEECGFISVLKWNSNEYELIGKIEGNIEFLSQQQKYLDLLLIPTKKGTISLPQISINSKKGVWKCGKRIKIL